MAMFTFVSQSLDELHGRIDVFHQHPTSKLDLIHKRDTIRIRISFDVVEYDYRREKGRIRLVQ
jgi:hypothetical protein